VTINLIHTVSKVMIMTNTQHTQVVTHQEWAQVIDQSAIEGRLYHFNGGQAYLKVGEELLVVDMSQTPLPIFQYHSGDFASNYFASCSPVSASERIAENPLTPFYSTVSVSQ